MKQKYIKQISGAIGITILERSINGITKKVIIFADNHNNSNYCGESFSTSYNIIKLLEKKKYNSHILLEEVKRSNNSKLKELWSSNEHTVELKNFYLNNTSTITPIDIRQYLYVVSWELLDDKTREFTMKKLLDNLFKFDTFNETYQIQKKVKLFTFRPYVSAI